MGENKITNNCTGCGACFSICPHKCITMQENRISELTPVINKKKCTNCGLCRKTCPQNNPVEKKNPQKCYVAWSREDSDLVYSASGGVAAVFARYQIHEGAPIYGCDYNEDLDLQHFCLINESDVLRMQSSKYSQSMAYIVFEQIKDELQYSKKVVFIGTPCQVAGLKKFLVKDFENLITVDLVCHGTPPNKYLKEYIHSLSIDSSIDKVRFRGEYDQNLTVWKKQKLLYRKYYREDLYFDAFYKNKISMNCCYNCQYAQSKRVSDITLADFWGLGELKQIEKKSDRPSLILINTERGEAYFEKLKDKLLYEERTVKEAIEGNGRLNKPPGKNLEASIFQSINTFTSFVTAVKLSGTVYEYTQRYFQLEKKVKKIYKRVKKAIIRRLKIIK